MEDDSGQDLNAESNSKIIHFLTNLIMSGRKEAPSLSKADSFQANKATLGKSPAMQFEVSNRNKIIINFVNKKTEPKEVMEEEEEIKEEKEVEKVKEKPKKGFFGRLFSSAKKKKKDANDNRVSNDSKPVHKFENVRILSTQAQREKLFGEFHRIIYDNYIQKITKIIHKHENTKIASELSKMNNFLNNTCTNKQLKKFIKDEPKEVEENEEDTKKEGIIKEESFENIRNSELENWYFDLESLSKIVHCLN